MLDNNMDNIKELNLAKLPLDATSFEDLRENDQIYVDKTAFIAKLARLKATYFLARPRRFGKSLLIDTLYNLFTNGLRDFKNLEIEKSWDDTTYNVIRINFSSYGGGDSEELKSYINEELLEQTDIKDRIKSYDLNGKYVKHGLILKKIAKYISNRSQVLLIDEYDSPITQKLDNKEDIKNIVEVLNNFYYAVKECSSKFRFIFITGVARISHLSIFSAFNNLLEITIDDDYANILGITEKELKKYFHPYIERAAKILNMPISDIYAALKNRYDGFKFSIASEQTLYNPWSIINFFLNPQKGFENYWFSSGGTPSILVNYIKINKNFDLWEYKNRQFSITKDELSAKSEVLNIDPKLLLTQAGYFTLNGFGKTYANLTFPNSEVEESMLRLYLTVNNIKIKNNTLNFTDNIEEYIDRHDINNIIKTFNLIINDCVSPKSKFFTDEYTLRDLIYANIPNIPTLFKQKEREYTTGRSDLELITNKTHLVIEFKLTRSNRSEKTALFEGIAQIKSRRYGEAYFSRQHLYRIVLVASHKEKRILYDFSCEVN